MGERLDYGKAAPAAMRALLGLDKAVANCGLEPKLLVLVQMRASQINGCAYCLDMHSKDLRAMGESEMRIYTLSAWRETPFFSDRERAALLWTETVTLISQDHAPDAVYEEVSRCFSEEELANLTIALALINSWNRLCISFRSTPGEYVSDRTPVA